jgi:DNA-binding NarL/FixJ family response regulator
MKEKITVLIADDQKLFVEGLVMILSAENIFNSIDTVYNGAEALKLLGGTSISLLITDLNMPELDGFGLIRQCKRKYPKLKILAVSVREDKHAITECIKTGVNGFLNKIAGKEEFLHAISEIVSGHNYFPPALMQQVLNHSATLTGEEMIPLSPREKEIVKMISLEKTTAEIAVELFISETTVITHRKKIFEKTGVKNMAGLVRLAIQQGLVD